MIWTAFPTIHSQSHTNININTNSSWEMAESFFFFLISWTTACTHRHSRKVSVWSTLFWLVSSSKQSFQWFLIQKKNFVCAYRIALSNIESNCIFWENFKKMKTNEKKKKKKQKLTITEYGMGENLYVDWDIGSIMDKIKFIQAIYHAYSYYMAHLKLIAFQNIFFFLNKKFHFWNVKHLMISRRCSVHMWTYEF